ncbi:hypothetical protein FU659_29170 [Paenibacillus sp. N3.4]|nr:hypothetical protein FU659_29170 [Paenibacillus sp. N3.4]
MSWDVMFMKLPYKVTKVEEINEDIIQVIGDRKEIVVILNEIFPDVDFTDPSWGGLDREGYSIEFNIPEEVNVTAVTLHVRGNNESIRALKEIHDKTGWTAMDETIIDFSSNPERGLEEWRSYRDHVVRIAIKKNKKWYEFWK